MNDWVDKELYPFQSNYFDLPMGRLHYIDEGRSGHAVVMVHGNPSWSFAYRHLIKGLSKNYRCIAPDHIGFGLSDKPLGWDYYPESHAENLKTFLKALKLDSITLIVEDWGGPIGLSYAVENPEKIKSLIIMNTWMWSVKGDPHFERFSGFMGSFLGRLLIKRLNFFARVVLKQAYGDKSKLTKNIHNHYLNALKLPNDRKGCWTFPKRIIESDQWLTGLWSQREKIANKQSLILWGKKDIAFRTKELERWKETFADAEIHEFDGFGHFVQEEMGEELCPIVERFLMKSLA